jgi:phosphoenolpyruvate carboxykinase (GTP)
VGVVPRAGELNTAGIDVNENTLDELLEIDPEDWTKEVESIKEFFEEFGERLPVQLINELQELDGRLKSSV